MSHTDFPSICTASTHVAVVVCVTTFFERVLNNETTSSVPEAALFALKERFFNPVLDGVLIGRGHVKKGADHGFAIQNYGIAFRVFQALTPCRSQAQIEKDIEPKIELYSSLTEKARKGLLNLKDACTLKDLNEMRLFLRELAKQGGAHRLSCGGS